VFFVGEVRSFAVTVTGVPAPPITVIEGLVNAALAAQRTKDRLPDAGVAEFLRVGATHRVAPTAEFNLTAV